MIIIFLVFAAAWTCLFGILIIASGPWPLSGGILKYDTLCIRPLLSVLIILRLKNQALYQDFIKGDRRGSEVMDYIDELIFDEELDSDLNDYLDLIEAGLYLTQAQSQTFVTQLRLIWQKEPLTHPEYLEYLSERTKKSGEEKLKKNCYRL